MEHITIDTTTQLTAENEREVLALCGCIFEKFDSAYLQSRLPLITDPTLTRAKNVENELIGFKLGYRIGSTLFFSWLGGVHPDHRRQGIAQRLMSEQHRWGVANGYEKIETRTRATNTSMIIMNLRSGFEIAGFELNASQTPVVTQRRDLLLNPE